MRFPTPLLALLTLLTLALGAPSSLKPRATDGWTIQDFTRDCRDENICIYGFTLDIYGFAQQHCTIIDVAEPGPATTHSWYNIPCEEFPDCHISWGFNYDGDFTVMTVVHVPTQEVAYFGYDHPNAGLPVVQYPDVGPYAVGWTGAPA